MAQFLYHLHIILHTLLYTLCPECVTHVLVVGNALSQVVLYHPYSSVCLLLGCNENVCWIDCIFAERRHSFHRLAIKFLYAVNLVIPKRHTENTLAVCHGDIYGVALHPECASLQRDVVPRVESVNKTAQKSVAFNEHAPTEVYDRAFHSCWPAHTVYARHRGDNNDIATAGE